MEQYVDYATNAPPLFKLIQSQNWQDVNTLLKSNPEQTLIWVVKSDIGSKSITWRRLPLHEACIQSAPSHIIDAILQAYPNASKSSDSYGRLAIHHACINGTSKEAIELLLLSNPQSLECRDVWGKTPLAIIETKPNEELAKLLSKNPSYYVYKNIGLKQKMQQEVLIQEFNSKMEDFMLKHQHEIETLQKKVLGQKAKQDDIPILSMLDENQAGRTWLWLWFMCVLTKVMNNKQILDDDNDEMPQIESELFESCTSVDALLEKNNEQMHNSVIQEASQHFTHLEQKACDLIHQVDTLK